AAAHSAHASPLQPNAQGSCSAHSPPSQRNVHPSSHLVTPSSQTTLEVPVPEAPPAPAPPSEAFPPAPASRRLKGPGGSSPAPPCGASPPAPAPCELPTLPPPPPDESDGCDARQVPSSHHCPGGQCSSRMHATSVGDGSSIPSTARHAMAHAPIPKRSVAWRIQSIQNLPSTVRAEAPGASTARIPVCGPACSGDRKSTRLNSSH